MLASRMVQVLVLLLIWGGIWGLHQGHMLGRIIKTLWRVRLKPSRTLWWWFDNSVNRLKIQWIVVFNGLIWVCKLCFRKAIEKKTDKERKESNMEQWDGEKIKQNLGQCIPQALNRLSTAVPPYANESRKTKMWIFPSKHTGSQGYRPLTPQWVHPGKTGMEMTGRHHSRSEDGVMNSALGRREQKGLPTGSCLRGLCRLWTSQLQSDGSRK